MNLYEKTYTAFGDSPYAPWLSDLKAKTNAIFSGTRWGDLPFWFEVRESLPAVAPELLDFTSSEIQFGASHQLSDDQRDQLVAGLKKMGPWRKGPFNLFGVQLDAEWRCDMKWDRLKSHIEPLDGRTVLDIGCGNGYYCWRMIGAGARWVLGIDPTMKYIMQFHMMQRYAQCDSLLVLPVGVEALADDLACADTVFSMGLLYHRKEPDAHLRQLMALLRSGGELVLETIVVDHQITSLLNPGERYAQMKNVHHIPSVPTLESWVRDIGFEDVRTVDVTPTTPNEQRLTDWIGQKSLADFLDPHDPSKTIEGYPAPQRAIVLAKRP